MAGLMATSPLARALAADRARYNARFRMAVQAWPRLDGEQFLECLSGTAGPIVDAVERRQGNAVSSVVDALYEASLVLTARALIGPGGRFPGIEQAWRTIFSAHPQLLAEAPDLLVTGIANASHRLLNAVNGRFGQWVTDMVRLGAVVQGAREWLEAGRVAAWRAGLPELRTSALALAAKGRPEAMAIALGLTGNDVAARDLAPLLEQLRGNPWLDPAKAIRAPGSDPTLRIVATAGGFCGVGGPFGSPPTVSAAGDGLYATDGQEYWRLYADAFGVAWHRQAPPTDPRSVRQTAWKVARDGTVQGHGLRGKFPVLAGASSCAADRSTLAVSVPDSHYVFLVASQGG